MALWKTGREIIIGAKIATTWRTAVALGALDGILITSESMGAKAPKYLDDDSLSLPDIMDSYRVAEAITGASLEGYLRYEGWDVLLALLLGGAGTPVAEEVTSTAYSNQIYIEDNIDDLFATIAMEKAGTPNGVWEIPSAKIHGFSVMGAIGELSKVTINFAGNKIENQSSTNTSTSFANVTYPDKHNIARLDSSFYVWMNAQDGGALSSGDAILPNSVTITYNRPVDEPYEAGNDDMAEPIQDGFAEATIEMVFDKYNLDTFMDAIAADEAQKMIVHFEGDVIATAIPYEFEVYMPKIIWQTADAPVGGAGKIGHTVTGRLMAVETAPTGMESTDEIGIDVVDPLAIRTVNTRTTSPLA